MKIAHYFYLIALSMAALYDMENTYAMQSVTTAATQGNGKKRKSPEATSFEEKARAAWKACRLSNIPRQSIDGEAFEPGLKVEIEKHADELLPKVLVDLIIKYCVPTGLRAAARRWDLSLLGEKLKIDFELSRGMDTCYGLSGSEKNVWVTARNKGSFTAYTTFKISLDKESNISCLPQDVNCRFGQDGENNELSSAGLLACSSSNQSRLGSSIVSLKNWRTVACSESPDGSLKIHRTWAVKNNLIIGSLAPVERGKRYKISVVNLDTYTYRDLPIDFIDNEGRVEHVILHQAPGERNSWVILFYRDRESRTQVIDIYESSTGKQLGCFSYSDTDDFLHIHEDGRSMIVLDPRGESSFLYRYALPAGNLISKTTLGVMPCQIIFNDVIWKAHDKDWKRVVVGTHPSLGATLHFPFESSDVLQSVADKQGKHFAAIVRVHESCKERLQLVVWDVTAD